VSRCLKLFGREIIFEVFPPVWKSYLNASDRQTDRRTDRQRVHDLLWHHRALRSIAG